MAYELQGVFMRVDRQLRAVPGVTLEQLAASIKVERHTIEKAVKAATGRTFRELRNDIVLQHARNILCSNPHQTIKEVAFQLGYRSQRSFSRFIRSSAGCTPKEFRQTKAS